VPSSAGTCQRIRFSHNSMQQVTCTAAGLSCPVIYLPQTCSRSSLLKGAAAKSTVWPACLRASLQQGLQVWVRFVRQAATVHHLLCRLRLHTRSCPSTYQHRQNNAADRCRLDLRLSIRCPIGLCSVGFGSLLPKQVLLLHCFCRWRAVLVHEAFGSVVGT